MGNVCANFFLTSQTRRPNTFLSCNISLPLSLEFAFFDQILSILIVCTCTCLPIIPYILSTYFVHSNSYRVFCCCLIWIQSFQHSTFAFRCILLPGGRYGVPSPWYEVTGIGFKCRKRTTVLTMDLAS